MGGLLTLAGVLLQHKLQTKDDKKKRRAEKFQELVSALYEHEEWLYDLRDHRAFGLEKRGEPRRLQRSGLSRRFIDDRISKFETVTREYEIWMLDAGQKRIRTEPGSLTVDPLLEGHKEVVAKYTDAPQSLLRDLREYAKEEFR